MVEHRSPKPRVAGSSPVSPAKIKALQIIAALLCLPGMPAEPMG